MVFPIESEDRTLRKLLMLCQDNARYVLEAYRKALITFDSLTKENRLSDPNQLEEIHKIKNDSTHVRNTLIKELNEVGGILVSRDDFLRLASIFSDMMDSIEAIEIRLVEFTARDWKITKTQAEGLAKMSDLLFDSFLKLRDSIMSLGFNSEKALAFVLELDDIEKQIDNLQIQVDLDIITSGIELPAMLLLRDIVSMVESLSDKVSQTSDLVRILAL